MPIKKLIEVAMPIKEISAESVRDKSIRHGHISTLHLWWARRPLPVCRAVVFASLVFDPLDERCPQAFRDAVKKLLADSAYKPYKDIPYTAIEDEMPDNLRNRLMMLIGKFSDTYVKNGKSGKQTPANEQLSAASLVKWDNKNNEILLNIARKLIWVAFHSAKDNALDFETLSADFDRYFQAIKDAEVELYRFEDRHLQTYETAAREATLNKAISDFLDRMPTVFDPFAGGGAIPLEAARLGCRSFGNDINPVAHIIEKCSLEFPQKYGKRICYSRREFENLYGKEGLDLLKEKNALPMSENISVEIANRLAFDVEYYARKLLKIAEAQAGHLYPANEKGDKPIAYYWARTATCANPSCRAEVPLLKQFYLANTKSKQIYLKPIIHGTNIEFEIKEGECNDEGWMNRANLTCPCCGSVTTAEQLKKQFINQTSSQKILAVIWNDKEGKSYKLPTEVDLKIIEIEFESIFRPSEKMETTYTQALPCCTWGISTWGDLFSNHQLYVLQTLIDALEKIKTTLDIHHDYHKAVISYLGVLIDRIAVANTTFGVWHTKGEKLERIMGRQAIPMVFDYPESNPFCISTGSAYNQLEWLTRYIESESCCPFSTVVNHASSGEKDQFRHKQLTAVVTDPPYYDAIAYADLSDFFYVWLKRTLGDVYPLNFATPQTPKTDECTALKHHHGNNLERAKKHFENKLLQIFSAIEHQTSDIVSIMYAHQSTEAWTTLCNSILGARMNITGSWATDTEMTGALKTDKAFLASSVTVSCRPAQREGYGAYRQVKEGVEERVAREVDKLYRLGFRGSDLLTACFGQAVSEFGKYETVEKADGSKVSVAELLEMAREAALNALLKGFSGDEYTKFYIGWLQLNGLSETDFDDAAKFTRIGLTINVGELFAMRLLSRNGNKQSLATYQQRLSENRTMGTKPYDCIIDQVHQAMNLYGGKDNDRAVLLKHIAIVASNSDSSFWRVLTALSELLPAGDDKTQADGLLTNKDNLLRECLQESQTKVIQGKMF